MPASSAAAVVLDLAGGWNLIFQAGEVARQVIFARQSFLFAESNGIVAVDASLLSPLLPWHHRKLRCLRTWSREVS
jgi:hypothetical protein